MGIRAPVFAKPGNSKPSISITLDAPYPPLRYVPDLCQVSTGMWLPHVNIQLTTPLLCGQSYKGSTIVNYDSRVVIWKVRYDYKVVI